MEQISSYALISIGVVIFMIFIVYYLRCLLKSRKITIFTKRWESWAKKNKKIPFWYHVLVISIGIIVALLCYLVIIFLHRPHFIMPSTDAINWYTVHHYPRQQDTFYFVTVFSFTTLFACLFWFICLIIKKRK